MPSSAHVDTFARDHLPPPEALPELIFDLPTLQFPAQLNCATELLDRAVQIFGGLGVVSGQAVEKLYREIRSLRIYEGATEVQKLIIARETLKG